ncbi:MAG: hypothetical protein HYU67_09175 [Flavobacteriia bacterium]|nr:hypothetical protein [Flavobacteriia bacterium]
MIVLSITGLLKTLFILIGVFVFLRFIGQLLIAKRNLKENEILNREKKLFQKEKELKQKYEGKINISQSNINAQDVDYEDIS